MADWLTWGGLTPDFTLESTRELFSEYHSKTFVEEGVAGFKLDEVCCLLCCRVPVRRRVSSVLCLDSPNPHS